MMPSCVGHASNLAPEYAPHLYKREKQMTAIPTGYQSGLGPPDELTIDPPDSATVLITAMYKACTGKKPTRIVLHCLDQRKVVINYDLSYTLYTNQVKDYLALKGFKILHTLFLPEKFGVVPAFIVEWPTGASL